MSALALPASQAAATGAVMCAVSLAGSISNAANKTTNGVMLAPTALHINLPKLPKLSFPDLNLDLPNFGNSKAAASTTKKTGVAPVPISVGGNVKVRVSTAVVASNPNAPTASDLSGTPNAADSVKPSDGWKRFPYKKMPGANMDGFKEMAKGMDTPGM